MRISARGNVIVETVAPGVRVMRFARPDVRQYLDDRAAAAASLLFQEVRGTALADLAEGWTLVVNLGLIDAITAAFYRCLLGIRESVEARGARLVLCGLNPHHQEIFELFQGPRVFTIVRGEAEACRAVLLSRRTRKPAALLRVHPRPSANRDRQAGFQASAVS